MRILLVDDDLPTRRLLDAMLRKMGYDTVHADDGVAAWEILQGGDINFVLSDWRMPRMDGVELCRTLRAAQLDHYVYVVMFTGRDQADDLVVAMEAGADDFLTKPVQAQELRVRIEAGRRVLSLEENLNARNRELQAANEALKSSQERIRRDLEAAAGIQQDLLPKAPLSSLSVDLAWDLTPAEELAGDIFSFYPLDDHTLGFYLVDVAGHGIPAAMLSVHLSKSLSAEPRPDSLVRLSGEETGEGGRSGGGFLSGLNRRPASAKGRVNKPYREPKEVAARLNSHFQDDDRNTLYFTMVYGVLDTRSGAGTLCQAGHPYPLVCRRDGSVQRLGSGGFPVGMLPEAQYEQVDFRLDPGDRILLYSDGITECFSPDREMFGERRLAECLTDCRSSSLRQTVEQIKYRLAQWHSPGAAVAGAKWSDDASLLAIELPAS
jgi:sigma-B regulation protein RsbU (phosphoserine phosphatase)